MVEGSRGANTDIVRHEHVGTAIERLLAQMATEESRSIGDHDSVTLHLTPSDRVSGSMMPPPRD